MTLKLYSISDPMPFGADTFVVTLTIERGMLTGLGLETAPGVLRWSDFEGVNASHLIVRVWVYLDPRYDTPVEARAALVAYLDAQHKPAGDLSAFERALDPTGEEL